MKIDGDDRPFDPIAIIELNVPTILWGGNHFANSLPTSTKWIVWDKRAASHHQNDFADCELAWTNLKGVVRIIRHHWDGMMKATERGVPRIHPTQKPVDVMKFCIDQLPVGVETVVDFYAGSFSTALACIQLDKQFIGVEKDPLMFGKAVERVRKAWDIRCSSLPFDKPPVMMQRSLID